ncbi:MAG: hypothetical protein H7A01_05015 [Hahellaceae bacterium]|nr:hypothetical protein [Hahellaceae bacterium]MCP5212780.1 hypothetical protein [Hahellaceae bacterium]
MSGKAEQYVAEIKAQRIEFNRAFNEFFSSIDEDKGSAITSFFDFFTEKSADIFSRQEEIAEDVHYPYAFDHSLKHKDLAGRAFTLKGRYGENNDITEDLKELIDDFTHHLNHEDTRIVEWIKVRAVMLGET